MDKKAFGKRLQKYREEVGFSQEKLSEKINRSSIFISYMERGQKSPSIDTLVSLANVLNVSADLLIGNVVQSNMASRIQHIEKKMIPLPPVNRQRLMDIFDSLVKIEMAYIKTDKEGTQ